MLVPKGASNRAIQFVRIRNQYFNYLQFLEKYELSRKKINAVAIKMDEALRAQFILDVSLYDANCLIFIDETSCDRRTMRRKYGYGLKGKPIRCQKLLVRGERLSIITAMTINGILEMHIERGTVTGDVFYEFVHKKLIPHLLPFNGYNSNSVIIMDNCSVHHVDGVSDVIQEMGCIVHYLPPYSPDLTPIELLFSKLKSLTRSMELEMNTLNDAETIVLSAFSSISEEDCRNWIDSIGIYNYFFNQ